MLEHRIVASISLMYDWLNVARPEEAQVEKHMKTKHNKTEPVVLDKTWHRYDGEALDIYDRALQLARKNKAKEVQENVGNCKANSLHGGY
jgi:predicted secreted acid phosphatase